MQKNKLILNKRRGLKFFFLFQLDTKNITRKYQIGNKKEFFSETKILFDNSELVIKIKQNNKKI